MAQWLKNDLKTYAEEARLVPSGDRKKRSKRAFLRLGAARHTHLVTAGFPEVCFIYRKIYGALSHR